MVAVLVGDEYGVGAVERAGLAPDARVEDEPASLRLEGDA